MQTIIITEDNSITNSAISVEGGTPERYISGFDKSIGKDETVITLKSIEQINTYYANLNAPSSVS